uniref:Transposase n=1 Tax=Pseudomonas urmiensis TaxID=2745493 RepID=A0A923G3E7_9PSED
MEQFVPWSESVAVIQLHYPQVGGGCKPYPSDTMLRTHLLQNWLLLSDPAIEQALHETTSMRQFARRRTERRSPKARLFPAPRGQASAWAGIQELINNYLQENGL